jgi:hypothetical protein
MRLKSVMRYDPTQRCLRLFRLLWTYGIVGDGKGYSAKLSFSLAPRIFGWHRESADNWYLHLAGLRIHYLRAWGGLIP